MGAVAHALSCMVSDFLRVNIEEVDFVADAQDAKEWRVAARRRSEARDVDSFKFSMNVIRPSIAVGSTSLRVTAEAPRDEMRRG